ncbi:MAG: hypothetical protein NVSMB25_14890 [Thermoleophilaceae bacterium]
MREAGALAAIVTVLALLLLPAGAQASAGVEVGVSRVDITPPTGYAMMGWVRSDGVVIGQHTRLWARVIVLRQGGRKVALVTEDLNGIPGGMMAAAADLDRDIGFSQENVLDSASHTHAAPTSYYNFSTYNSVFMTLRSPTDFNLTGTIDPQLYAFMVRRLALALREADANLGPGQIGWGMTQIPNLTENRSLEAHLYNYGIHLGYGQGTPSMDPHGALNTINPDVNVLRVDKLQHGRAMPVGMWSTFANHGTVNKFQFTYYNEDHHGAATHGVEDAIRAAGHVPDGQPVVDAYGNSDEGDISSGLHRSGPAAADFVGQVEARAFLDAWRRAGAHMERTPKLDLRWTRMCFCGQQTPDGPVADQGAFGLSQFTGSEEGRGPLFDVTRTTFEGDHLPIGPSSDLPGGLPPTLPAGTLPGPVQSAAPGVGPQGDKILVPIPVDTPKAVPLMTMRVGDRMIASIPGEMTVEMGRRVRASVMNAAAGSGVAAVVISGLANEYADYFTTPQEFDAQHYEGGATIYGRASSDALQQTLTELAGDLAAGRPAPPAYPFDPRNGVSADAAPFSTGASSATPLAQPGSATTRLERPAFSWRGGPRGFDRPLDRAFVVIERQVTISARQPAGRRRHRARRHHRRHHRARRPAYTARHRARSRRRAAAAPRAAVTRWSAVDSDLALNVLWSVDRDGAYRAEWEVPLSAPAGRYRFVIHANGYSLSSSPFSVGPSTALTVSREPAAPGRVAVALRYPQPVVQEDVGDPPPDAGTALTYRPPTVSSGSVRFVVGGRAETVRASGGRFEVAAAPGTPVEVQAGAAQDDYGNRNGAGLSITP